MSTSKKSLFLGGISVLLLCGTLDAEARKHKSDGKKPDEAAAAPATPDAGAAAAKAPDTSPPATAPAAAAPGPAKTPAAAAPTSGATAGAAVGAGAGKAGVGVSVGAGKAGVGVSVGAGAGKTAPPPSAPAPAPAAEPKALATEVSGPKQEAARAHFERGVELYTQGDFPNAWLEFNSAYQIVPLPDLLNNVARCEVRMGRPQQALEHFQRFLAARPSDPDSEYIRQEIARLEGELGRTKTAVAAEPEAPPPPAAPRRVPIYGIMTGATTLAVLIAGAVTLGVTNSNYNDLQTRCSPMCFAEDVAVLQRQAYAGYGLLGVAAAGAAATGIVLFFELRGSKENSLRPLAGLRGGIPLSVSGRF